ncbi:MAG: hypothetical protein M9950_02695 [Thermomicrobiales bacterium]|nr:hypothetical protein [Thermomicrobiales bacterium]
MLIYAQVTEDVVGTVDLFEMIITNADVFAEELAAQQEIEIDGIPFLVDVDGAALTGSTTDTDAGDDIDDDAGLSGNPREDARIGDGQTTVSGLDSTPEVNTGDDDGMGILTDSSRGGPVSGQAESELNPSCSAYRSRDGWFDHTSEEDLVDSITLSADGWVTTPYAYLAVIDDQAHSPADYLGYWSSDEYVLGVLIGSDDGEYEVLSSRSRTNGVGVVILYTINGTDYVRVNQMTELEDGTLFMSQIDTSVDEIAEAFDVATAVRFDVF